MNQPFLRGRWLKLRDSGFILHQSKIDSMVEHPALTGTPFQLLVWNALKEIPRGEVRTYKQLAAQIGRPQSIRAVANACGKNPYIVVIPCHRVIRSDGGLGGYSGSGGIEEKRRLLEQEGVHIRF